MVTGALKYAERKYIGKIGWLKVLTSVLTSSPIKINTEPFKEWMTNILFMAKADTLLQGMDGCNKSGEINRIPLKNSNA